MPAARAKSVEELAEERRIAYVGMSRAADHLYLTGCEYRSGDRRVPSRFWWELGSRFDSTVNEAAEVAADRP
jgi:superfamily I DNA/RNA helicase